MKKFTSKNFNKTSGTKKDNILYSNDYMKIVGYEDYSIIKEKDSVVCIPYLIEYNQIILRHEYIPTFKYRDNEEYHITVISGQIEDGESSKKTLIRELEEEAGIVIRPDFNVEFMKPLFVSKGHSSKYHPCIITLSESDYEEVIARGDGSDSEKKSQSVKIDLKYLKSINPSDLITEFMLLELKRYLNLL